MKIYDDQFWRFERVDSVDDRVYYRLRNYNSWQCLVVYGTAKRARLEQIPCDNTAPVYVDQQWA